MGAPQVLRLSKFIKNTGISGSNARMDNILKTASIDVPKNKEKKRKQCEHTLDLLRRSIPDPPILFHNEIH